MAHAHSRIRLWILLGLLFVTVVGAAREMRSRRARTEWQRPVALSVTLVELGAVDEQAVRLLSARLPALEARLSAEYHRYGGRLPRPVEITLFGPVNVDRAPPPRSGL